MNATEVLTRLGGVASRSQLLQHIDRLALEVAVDLGEIIRDARGRYSLPSTDEALRAASRLAGTVSHLSAALAHGWQVKTPPAVPHVTLSEHRKLTKEQRRDVVVHRGQVPAADRDGWVTSVDRTLVDCLRSLPFDEALAVADSARRVGAVSRAHLLRLAASTKGPGSRQVRRVALLASPKAANPFESVLRALAIEAGLDPLPQEKLGEQEFLGQPDLVDPGLGIVLEADSFTWHGDRRALREDARRYDEFVAAGWLVLRFAWEDVMHDQAWVRSVLCATVARTERTLELLARA